MCVEHVHLPTSASVDQEHLVSWWQTSSGLLYISSWHVWPHTKRVRQTMNCLKGTCRMHLRPNSAWYCYHARTDLSAEQLAEGTYLAVRDIDFVVKLAGYDTRRIAGIQRIVPINNRAIAPSIRKIIAGPIWSEPIPARKKPRGTRQRDPKILRL